MEYVIENTKTTSGTREIPMFRRGIVLVSANYRKQEESEKLSL